eukprot:GHVL01024344.1.p1 GENE.GHVL01024344.1~~GHVL01024344.1.p1  ORF type:complete len:125 (+),score=20.21 GHVL01024344.1:23-376(+)
MTVFFIEMRICFLVLCLLKLSIQTSDNGTLKPLQNTHFKKNTPKIKKLEGPLSISYRAPVPPVLKKRDTKTKQNEKEKHPHAQNSHEGQGIDEDTQENERTSPLDNSGTDEDSTSNV